MNKRAFILIFSLSARALFASEPPYLSLDLWIDHSFSKEILSPDDFDAPYLRESKKLTEKNEHIRTLLKEAQWYFSGMIYGFTFSYTPKARQLEIEGEFILEPQFQIPYGDDNLEVRSVIKENHQVHVIFDYWMSPEQIRRREYIRLPRAIRVTGAGQVDMWEEDARFLSFQEAIRSGIKEDLRDKVYNRPKRVEGLVYLIDPPSLSLRAGAFHSFVTFYYKADKITKYPLP